MSCRYMQGDNEVVNDGEDCVAEDIFGGTGTCGNSGAAFSFIGIGNGSSGTVNAANSTLADGTDDTTGTCATNSAGGDMARKPAVVSHTAASGATGAIVELDTSTIPFAFDSSNATAVIDSGVFNNDYVTASPTNVCASSDTYGSGGSTDMFARQLLNTNQGITVSDGDSLSVKWTITVG